MSFAAQRHRSPLSHHQAWGDSKGRGVMPSSVDERPRAWPRPARQRHEAWPEQKQGSLPSREVSIPPGDTGLQTNLGRREYLQTKQHLAGWNPVKEPLPAQVWGVSLNACLGTIGRRRIASTPRLCSNSFALPGRGNLKVAVMHLRHHFRCHDARLAHAVCGGCTSTARSMWCELSSGPLALAPPATWE